MTDDSGNGLDDGLRALEATSTRLIDAVTDVSKRLNTTERMARQLADQQEDLRKTQEAQSRQGKVNFWLAASLALDLVLSVVIGLGFVQIDDNADHITEIQDRTSDRVLCPLYGVFLTSIENPRPDQVDTPEEREAFAAAARTIRDGYSALDCQDHS